MEAPSISANPTEQETQTGNVNPKRRKCYISNSSDDGLSTCAELAKEEAGEISKAWNHMVDTISAEPPVMVHSGSAETEKCAEACGGNPLPTALWKLGNIGHMDITIPIWYLRSLQKMDKQVQNRPPEVTAQKTKGMAKTQIQSLGQPSDEELELVFAENSYEDPEASESPVTASKSGYKSMKPNREEPQDATTPASRKQKNEQPVSDSSNLYQCFETWRKKATTLSDCFAEMQKMVVKGHEILRRVKGYEAHLNYMWDNLVTQTHIDAIYESIKRYNQYILNRSIEHRQIGRESQNAVEVSDSSRDKSQPLHANVPDSPDDEGPPAMYAERMYAHGSGLTGCTIQFVLVRSSVLEI
ncbi:hypothetical protein JD844_027244 [Phrynosoma platyrhinos]|uniref:Uncharacterized protein n=1 Tax=Phrynosoma platyrhinos TaxID=52577 RepID=A0ABQ7SG64_PHRPL|nr:hypothetical protein JD844_027244 [Phrynosoma platyrhinos]